MTDPTGGGEMAETLQRLTGQRHGRRVVAELHPGGEVRVIDVENGHEIARGRGPMAGPMVDLVTVDPGQEQQRADLLAAARLAWTNERLQAEEPQVEIWSGCRLMILALLLVPVGLFLLVLVSLGNLFCEDSRSSEECAVQDRGVVLGAVALVVLDVILFVVGLRRSFSSLEGRLVNDDLGGGTGPFPAERDSRITLEYVDGGYRMALSGADVQMSRTLWRTTERGVAVAVDVEVRGEPEGAYAVGVACVGPSTDYVFAVDSNGQSRLDLEDHGTGQRELLVEGHRFMTTPGDGIRLQLECRRGNDARTDLVGSVGGVRALWFRDPEEHDSFRGMGLRVESAAAIDVLWHDAHAQRLA